MKGSPAVAALVIFYAALLCLMYIAAVAVDMWRSP